MIQCWSLTSPPESLSIPPVAALVSPPRTRALGQSSTGLCPACLWNSTLGSWQSTDSQGKDQIWCPYTTLPLKYCLLMGQKHGTKETLSLWLCSQESSSQPRHNRGVSVSRWERTRDLPSTKYPDAFTYFKPLKVKYLPGDCQLLKPGRDAFLHLPLKVKTPLSKILLGPCFLRVRFSLCGKVMNQRLFSVLCVGPAIAQKSFTFSFFFSP